MDVSKQTYQVADADIECELVVTRSRFICFLSPCQSADDAKTMVKRLQHEYPQASHHCYAFLTGSPNDSQGYGFSDDGEPSGTAGRPMLAALQGGNIGQICAVVVRYFGGTKLGTGGLQRAYGGSVRDALLKMPSKTKIPMVRKTLACQYSQVNDVQHLLASVNGEIIEQTFDESVGFEVDIPLAKIASLQQQLQTISAGQITLRTLSVDNENS